MASEQFWTLDGGSLTLLEPASFASEDELQALVARYPELLARSVDDDLSAPTWLSIGREAAINFFDADERTRWSLDNLYVDASAVPTLVEVKRAGDPRIRREVVAQLLDYAASFRADWGARRLEESWARFAAETGAEPTAAMAEFLAESDYDTPGEFWQAVDERIHANKLRLLIVADEIPTRLRRIIEYLNEQMTGTEVLGVEIRPRQSAGERDGRSFSVSVVGATEAAAATKGRSGRRTEAEFDQILQVNRGEEEFSAVRSLLAALTDDGAWLTVGTAASNPMLFANYTAGDGRTFWPIAIKPRQGRLVLQLRWLAYRSGFTDDSDRREFRDRMAKAAGFTITGRINGFPWVPTSVLVDEERRAAVVDVVRWAVHRVQVPAGPG